MILTLGVNLFDISCDRVQACIRKLDQLASKYTNLRLVALQFPEDQEVPAIFARVNLNERYNKKYPVIYEMMNALANVYPDTDVFALVNSDIIMTDRAIETLLRADCDSLSMTRGDILDDKIIMLDATDAIRFDLIAFKRDWWLANAEKFKELPAVYALPVWDTTYVFQAGLLGRHLIFNKVPLILHPVHKARWFCDDADSDPLYTKWRLLPMCKMYYEYKELLKSRHYVNGVPDKMNERFKLDQEFFAQWRRLLSSNQEKSVT